MSATAKFKRERLVKSDQPPAAKTAVPPTSNRRLSTIHSDVELFR